MAVAKASDASDGWACSLRRTPSFCFAVFWGGVDQREDGVADVRRQIRPALADVAQRLVAVSRCRFGTIFAAGALPMRCQGFLAVS